MVGLNEFENYKNMTYSNCNL